MRDCPGTVKMNRYIRIEISTYVRNANEACYISLPCHLDVRVGL